MHKTAISTLRSFSGHWLWATGLVVCLVGSDVGEAQLGAEQTKKETAKDTAKENAKNTAKNTEKESEKPSSRGEDLEAAAFGELVEKLVEHVKKVDAIADRLKIPEFPAGKDWFNSPPLTFAKELRGKITVLDFWTYCCINCIHILPDLLALEKKYAGQPVAFVGVHSAKFANEKVSENIRQAVLRYEIEHPVINDDDMTLWKSLPWVNSWPTLVVVGPRGNLLLVASGEGNRTLIDACITAALKYYPASDFRYDPVPLALERDKKKSGASALSFPGKLAIDAAGKRMFISDSNHHRVVVTDLAGKFAEVIGTGRIGLVDGAYNEARFNRLQGLAFHEDKLYVADAENHALRVVDLKAKRVSTLAGDGTQGRDYQGGKGGSEQLLSTPWDVYLHGGQVYIAMAGTHQIWSYDLEKKVARNYSGSGREQNYNDEDPLLAAWSQPSGLAVGAGELFIADSESSAIRGIKLATGVTRTIVGGDDAEPRNLFAFGDVDGKGDSARLQHPLGVLWLENRQRVLVADTYNHRLKFVDPKENTVKTAYGSGQSGFKDGKGTAAQFAEPSGFALLPGGKKVFVADTNNHRIRVVDLESEEVTTLEIEGVPPAEAPFVARTRRLADMPGSTVKSTAPLKLRKGETGHVRIRLELPEGFKYTAGAGSRWQVLDEDNGVAAGARLVTVEEKRASGALQTSGQTIEIPVKAGTTTGKERVRVEALAYFCKEDGVCLVGAVVVDVPVEVGAGGAPEVKAEHRFKDASKSFGSVPGLQLDLPKK